jgi:hypothetical protein
MGQSDVAGTITLPGQGCAVLMIICLLMLFTAFDLATTQVPVYPIYIPSSTNSRYYNYAKVSLDIVGDGHKVALTTTHRQAETSCKTHISPNDYALCYTAYKPRYAEKRLAQHIQ